MNVAVCITRLKNGKLSVLPWGDNIQYLIDITTDKYVIMSDTIHPDIGYKLKSKKQFVITKKNLCDSHNLKYCSFHKMLKYLECMDLKEIFVIGGTDVYKLFDNRVDKIHVKVIKTTVDLPEMYYEFPKDFKLVQYNENEFIYNKTKVSADSVYSDLLNSVLKTGNTRDDRTGTGTISTFGSHISIDISDYTLPLITTKFVSFRMITEELLWFLKGETDVKLLKDVNVNIWNQNTSREFLDSTGKPDYPEGVLIEGYGTQIRNFNGFDQLKYIEDLIENDPNSRRIMWNLWNANKLGDMVLPPCHNQVQFYVDNGKLSCHMYQRSIDLFLGFPWNIASYSLFTFILCKRHSLEPGTLYISGGDTHIYKNHIEQVKTQLSRQPRPSPKVVISNSIKDLDWKDISSDLFKLIGYLPHSSIKAEMS